MGQHGQTNEQRGPAGMITETLRQQTHKPNQTKPDT